MMTAQTSSIMANERLCTPSEPNSLRRLSDSIIRGPQDKLATENETELGQLRQWASEAMKARPDNMLQQPIVEEAPCKSERKHRTLSYRHPSPPLDASSSPSGRRSSFLLNGLQARLTSMLATMPSVDPPRPSTLLPSSSTTSLERSASVRRKPQGRRIVSAPETGPNGEQAISKPETPKSSAALPPSPGSSGQGDVDSSFISPRRDKGSKAHGLHLSLSANHSLLYSPDERTPRGKTTAGLSSPAWTPSTSDSDDDKFNIMTPSDGQSPYHQRKQVVAAPSSHHNLERGLDNLGSSAEHTMHSMTGITLAGRRGSLSVTNKSNRVSFALPTTSESDNLFNSMSPTLATASAIKNTTLFEVGSVNGITPPALREHSMYSTDSPSSQVVSAGLEMGLGVTMAVSALSCNMPATSSSSINMIAEPRFSHNAVPMSAHHVSQAAGSDQMGQDMSFTRLDREDAELARRRTTGSLAGNKREAGVIGIRRHIRAGTHDPRGIGLALSTTGSAPGSAVLPEEAQCPIDGLRLDTSDRIRNSKTSSSDTYSADSTTNISSQIGSTPTGTPFGSHKGMVSPDASADLNRRSFISSGDDASAGRFMLGGVSGKGKDVHKHGLAVAAEANVKTGGALLGMGGGGHFGPGVRAKIAEVLVGLLEEVPLQGHDSETIQLVEYGSLNSRSSQLMQPIISAFVNKQARSSQQLVSSHDTVLGADGTQTSQSSLVPLSFQVTHEDSSSADFRPLTQSLDLSSESYLDAQWQNSQSPSLANSIFSSFVARPFASRIAPPGTFHAGMSLMDLHWIHTPSATISPALTAQAELTTFLAARASEFKKGGLFIMAYIARSEPQQKDIWTTLSNMLAPCIQRLVSCSMVKSDVARHLLNLPMHPRSAKQTKSVLQSVEAQWKVEWSCGLDDAEARDSNLASEAQPLRIPHPAWKAYNSGTLSRVPFTEHMVQLFKNLYESHFRNVLREKGKLSKGAVEFVLDSLWDVLFSRIVDQDPSPMKDIEVEVSIVALRRR